MNPTLTPSQFTSPDIRPRGVAALPAANEQDLDMRQIQEDLAAALRYVESLRPDHPYP